METTKFRRQRQQQKRKGRKDRGAKYRDGTAIVLLLWSSKFLGRLETPQMKGRGPFRRWRDAPWCWGEKGGCGSGDGKTQRTRPSPSWVAGACRGKGTEMGERVNAWSGGVHRARTKKVVETYDLHTLTRTRQDGSRIRRCVHSTLAFSVHPTPRPRASHGLLAFRTCSYRTTAYSPKRLVGFQPPTHCCCCCSIARTTCHPSWRKITTAMT